MSGIVDLQLLTESPGDQIKRIQVMLRYLQDHGNLDPRNKVEITGQSSDAGNKAFDRVIADAGVDHWYNHLPLSSTQEDALKQRFAEQYRKQTNKHIDISDDKTMLAAQNAAYQEILKAEYRAGGTGKNLLGRENTSDLTLLASQQVMLRYLQENDGLAGNKVNITGNNNDDTRNALKAAGINGSDSPETWELLRNRFVEVYNAKHENSGNWVRADDNIRVWASINEVLEGYMSRTSKPGLLLSKTAQARANQPLPQDPDAIASVTDDEVAAIARVFVRDGRTFSRRDEAQMVREFQEAINSSDDFKGVLGGKDLMVRSDGKMYNRAREVLAMADDIYAAVLQKNKEQLASNSKQASPAAQEQPATKNPPAHAAVKVPAAPKSAETAQMHTSTPLVYVEEVAMAQIMDHLAAKEKGADTANYKQYGSDGKNGILTHPELDEYHWTKSDGSVDMAKIRAAFNEKFEGLQLAAVKNGLEKGLTVEQIVAENKTTPAPVTVSEGTAPPGTTTPVVLSPEVLAELKLVTADKVAAAALAHTLEVNGQSDNDARSRYTLDSSAIELATKTGDHGLLDLIAKRLAEHGVNPTNSTQSELATLNMRPQKNQPTI